MQKRSAYLCGVLFLVAPRPMVAFWRPRGTVVGFTLYDDPEGASQLTEERAKYVHSDFIFPSCLVFRRLGRKEGSTMCCSVCSAGLFLWMHCSQVSGATRPFPLHKEIACSYVAIAASNSSRSLGKTRSFNLSSICRMATVAPNVGIAAFITCCAQAKLHGASPMDWEKLSLKSDVTGFLFIIASFLFGLILAFVLCLGCDVPRSPYTPRPYL